MRGGPRSFAEIIDDLREQEERWNLTKDICWDGLSTGFPSLDEMTGGFHPGDVIVLGARTGHGKTSMGNQMAWRVADALRKKHKKGGEHKKVVLFSPEMRDTQVFMRQACLMSGVQSWDLQTGRADDDEREDWDFHLDRLEELEPYFTIFAGEDVYLQDIKSVCAAERDQIALVVVDYVQRILDEKRGNSYERVSGVSRQIKTMANKYGFTFLAMAQLNRELEKDSKGKDGVLRKPMLSDLQNTSGLEQDADGVWLIHRPAAADGGGPLNSEVAVVILAKQRSGPSNVEVELIYNAPLTYFEDPLW